MKLYGIPNCDTVKKARHWLSEHGYVYDWIDYKKTPPSTELLAGWIAQMGWEVLVNKQGTTWKKLDAETQAKVVDAASAIALMQEKPSLIKRPVLVRDGRISVGFKPEHYESLFQ